MRKMAKDANRIMKAIVISAIALFLLAHVQVHASVAGANVSASVLALIAGFVGLLVLAALVFLVLVVTREFRAGVYRPKHA